jgi:hypothetical protein
VLASGATAGDLVETVSFYVSSVLNAIPAVANAVTETYINTGAVTQSKLGAGVAGNGPAFSAYNNASQTATNNTDTRVLFQSELYDTAGCFSSSRFTPNVAGYYQLNSAVKMQNPGAAGTAVIYITKNGVEQGETQIPVTSGYNVSPGISMLVYANGSTDYFDVYFLQVTGSSQTIVSNGILATWFQGSLVRAA